MSLDQFYTRPEIARECFAFFLETMGEGPWKFIEPSAGRGDFFRLLPAPKFGIDLEPKADGIVQGDFLRWPGPDWAPAETAVVGNPPFGVRSKTAIRFFQRAGRIADTVAFILPTQFRRYSAQRHLPFGFRLVGSLPLPLDAFYLPEGKGFAVRCDFQVWTSLMTRHRDMRVYHPSSPTHPDFVLWRYNHTRTTLKALSKPFDFAVVCQGYTGYQRREFRAEDCELSKHWMLFHSPSERVLQRLIAIDYEALSRGQTAMPGYSKGDVVAEYTHLYP